MTVRILNGDAREQLRTLPNASVHCVVTSPPYWGLRDYGTEGQLGLEPTPEEYTANMVGVFREIRRVLRDDGTCWVNLGDSYNSTDAGKNPGGFQGKQMRRDAARDSAYTRHGATAKGKIAGLKPKDLVGIPWRVAFALQADGWWLRQDIIWSKPNPMPESVRDRCTKAHEYMFMLSKSARYYYDADAISEPAVLAGDTRHLRTYNTQVERAKPKQDGHGRRHEGFNSRYFTGNPQAENRNKRSVWTITTQPFPEAHFATFPPALVEPCIKAGCPEKCCAKCGAPWVRLTRREKSFESGSGRSGNPIVGKQNLGASETNSTPDIRMGPTVKTETIGWEPSCNCDAGTTAGTVLDPFGGSGTTGLVADRLGRNAVLIELNPEYAEMAERRIKGDAGLFAEVSAA